MGQRSSLNVRRRQAGWHTAGTAPLSRVGGLPAGRVPPRGRAALAHREPQCLGVRHRLGWLDPLLANVPSASATNAASWRSTQASMLRTACVLQTWCQPRRGVGCRLDSVGIARDQELGADHRRHLGQPDDEAGGLPRVEHVLGGRCPAGNPTASRHSPGTLVPASDTAA
jgi:hypothetical protein